MSRHAKRLTRHGISEGEEKTARGKNNPTGPSSRRKLSIGDAPDTLRVTEGGLMNEFPDWLNTNIISSIHQLKEASRGTSRGAENVQILLNVIECKPQLATVAHQGGESCIDAPSRTIENAGYINGMNYAKKRAGMWGGGYYQIAEKIQSLGPYVRHGVTAKLNSCGIFAKSYDFSYVG